MKQQAERGRDGKPQVPNEKCGCHERRPAVPDGQGARRRGASDVCVACDEQERCAKEAREARPPAQQRATAEDDREMDGVEDEEEGEEHTCDTRWAGRPRQRCISIRAARC